MTVTSRVTVTCYEGIHLTYAGMHILMDWAPTRAPTEEFWVCEAGRHGGLPLWHEPIVTVTSRVTVTCYEGIHLTFAGMHILMDWAPTRAPTEEFWVREAGRHGGLPLWHEPIVTVTSRVTVTCYEGIHLTYAGMHILMDWAPTRAPTEEFWVCEAGRHGDLPLRYDVNVTVTLKVTVTRGD